jgi:hypothetical protein
MRPNLSMALAAASPGLHFVCDIQRQLEQPGMIGDGRGIARRRDDRVGRESRFHDQGAEPAGGAGDEPGFHVSVPAFSGATRIVSFEVNVDGRQPMPVSYGLNLHNG